MSIPTSAGRVQRVRHEIKQRELHVVRVNPVSATVQGVTFTGESLDDFISESFDDHLKLIIDVDGGETVRRDYTPRHYDRAARELTLEFALHGTGPAAKWAAQATPGQCIRIAGPRSSFVVPLDYDWHLLVGDESALPAIARRLEELPSNTRVFVIAHVADQCDRRDLSSAAMLDMQWVGSADELINAVRTLPLPRGDGFAWCAGEAAVTSNVRHILVEEKGLERHAIRASAYWKRGASAHHEELAD